MDDLFNGELSKFEAWVIERNRRRGNTGEPLLSVERGIIKAYLYYVATTTGFVEDPNE